LAPRTADMKLLEMACQRGLISNSQLERIRQEHTRIVREGSKKSPSQLAVERGFLSEEASEELETEAWIQGLPTRLNDYQIERLVGRGGMAVVFEARDCSLGKSVALKALLPQFASSDSYLARFHREARIAAKLTHPNTIQVFGAGEGEGVHYLVMEYVAGETLSSVIRDRGRMPEKEALDIVLGIAGAVEEASDLGIVHRDIKPGNVIMSKWGIPKLGDFGIAKEFADIPDPRLQASLTLGVVGTPMYMSPEQARGARQLDFRSDIYALGTTLYHMVVGDLPFYADTPQETMFRVVTEAARPPRAAFPGMSEQTAAVICRMMAKDPEARYPTFQALRNDLVCARDGEDVSIPYAEAARLLLPTGKDEDAQGGGAETQDMNPLRALAVASAVAIIGTAILLVLRGCS